MAVNDQVPGRLSVALAGAHPMRWGRVLTVEFAVNVAGTRPPASCVSVLQGAVY